MPNPPTTNFKDSDGVDLGTKFVTTEYLMAVYPQIVNQNITGSQLWTIGRGTDGLGINRASGFICTPVTTFAGVSNWQRVCAKHTLTLNNTSYAIKTDGSLWGWGYSCNNVLGQSLPTDSSSIQTPVPISFGSAEWANVKWKFAICVGLGLGGSPSSGAAGQDWAYGIRDDDTLWVWGGNFGVPNGANVASFTNGYFTTPVQIFGGGTWKQIDGTTGATGPCVAAIKTDGTLWTWGFNDEVSNGEVLLGINRSGMVCTPVTTFAGGDNWKKIAGGAGFSAIKSDGTLWVWGSGANGQLGNNTSVNASTPVTTFAGGNNWMHVFSGGQSRAAIKTDGTLWMWGSNDRGQLGINLAGATGNRSTPVTTFAGGNNWRQVAICNRGGTGDGTTAQTYALKIDGTLWCWGRNHRGQLGTNQAYGTNSNLGVRCTPVTTFAGGSNWKQISTSKDALFAIRSTGAQ